MKQIIITVLLLLSLISPLASADIILQRTDEASGIILNGTLDVELRDAIVEINMIDENDAYMKAVFDVYSNEENIVKTKVYLRAKGQDCYGGSCQPADFMFADFRIKNTEPIVFEGGQKTIDVYDFNEYTIRYETEDGVFPSSLEFTLAPKQVMKIGVFIPVVVAPFEYYLDSLSTFTKADHEKITIYGENLDVEFNDEYPVEKISENEWVWEYSNLDVEDPALKDILTISQPTEKSFFQRIAGWFKNLF